MSSEGLRYVNLSASQDCICAVDGDMIASFGMSNQQAGARFFGTTKATETFKELDISADQDSSIEIPDMEGRPVPASAADVLPWTPEWTKWPDFERVSSWLCCAAAPAFASNQTETLLLYRQCG